MRTGYMSTHRSQNEDRVAIKKSEVAVPRFRFAASDRFMGLGLRSFAGVLSPYRYPGSIERTPTLPALQAR